MSGSAPPLVSVVLATRNRAARLGRLLDHLSRQRGAPPFEIVLADNGSLDDTPRVIERASLQLDLTSVRVGEPGKGRALNSALRKASGELIVFTDDDVVPHDRWLAELFEASRQRPEIPIFGGAIRVADEAPVPQWIRRSPDLMGLLASEHDWAVEPTRYSYGRYPFGPNMAVRRRLLKGCENPYPEDLGPGTSLPVGDEGAFLTRFSSADSSNRLFVPSAVVEHTVEPGNVTLRAALTRSYFAGRASRRSGIPMSPPGQPGAQDALWRRASRRLVQATSVREMLCICARHAGYRSASGKVRAGRS